MEFFPTKDEAIKKQDELNKKEPIEFCPLLKGTCQFKCVCFQKAFVKKGEGENGSWGVFGFCCGNAMFSEYRTCQV
jgi:hypothetical protein